MYNEEKNEKTYFFRNLIVKILLVLLFVFLLMWLFPMPNLNPFYDKIFSENIINMTDAAKGYFTTARLPKTEGETKTLTLKEMLDNKMLIEFTDSDGKSCDVNASYVEVTKKDGEYIFKTNLSCSTGEDYVIEYFGCYDVCENDECKVETNTSNETKKVTEYQFYKTTTSKYIDSYLCKEGYTLEGNKCILTTNVDESEAAKLTCLSGYTYNSSTNKCVKTIKEENDATKVCSNGYTYSNSLDKCVKTNTLTEAAKESCSDGSTPVNGVCKKTTYVNATQTCSNGSAPVNGLCTITKIEDQIVVSSYCATGTDNGTNCAVTSTYDIPQTCTPYSVCSYSMGKEICSTSYKCTGGGTGTTTSYVEKTNKYGCSDGSTPVNGKCITTGYEYPKDSCNDGSTPVNGKCVITTKTDSTKTCNNGTLVNGMCTTTNTVSKDYTLNCAYGTLSGSKCVVTTYSYADPTYSCNSGYTLAGETCYITSSKTDIIDAEAVYKTKTEKAYKWSTKETLSGWTRTGKTRTTEVAITSK